MPAADRRAPTVLRIGDLSSAVVATTHMLGFQPRESLVAVALCGPRERMTFVVRVDLPPPAGHGAVAAEVATRMAQAGADGVMLFVHTSESAAGAELPHRELVDAVVASLDAPVREATLVSAGRLWSYVCDDQRCCPAEGRPFDPQSPDSVAVAAAHALEGNTVLPDRETAVGAARPLGGITAVSMRQALDRAAAEMAADDEFAEQVDDEIVALTERFVDPRASLTDDEAARVAIALHDIVLRDDILVRVIGDDGPLHRLLQAVARRAQPPDDAPVCTCVGFAAYAGGNGLLALEHLERALRTDPGYSMAQLARQALLGQLPPEAVRGWARDVAPVVRAQVRSRRRR
jgi:hypothetical protein